MARHRTIADSPKVTIQPTLEGAKDVLAKVQNSSHPPNLVPLCATVPADLLTPTLAYLKISAT